METTLEAAETLLHSVEQYISDHPEFCDHTLECRVTTLKNLIYLGVEKDIEKEMRFLEEEFFYKTHLPSLPCLP